MKSVKIKRGNKGDISELDVSPYLNLYKRSWNPLRDLFLL